MVINKFSFKKKNVIINKIRFLLKSICILNTLGMLTIKKYIFFHKFTPFNYPIL